MHTQLVIWIAAHCLLCAGGLLGQTTQPSTQPALTTPGAAPYAALATPEDALRAYSLAVAAANAADLRAIYLPDEGVALLIELQCVAALQRDALNVAFDRSFPNSEPLRPSLSPAQVAELPFPIRVEGDRAVMLGSDLKPFASLQLRKIDGRWRVLPLPESEKLMLTRMTAGAVAIERRLLTNGYTRAEDVRRDLDQLYVRVTTAE